MKERPILFNGDMVRAILGGRKTQTRRAVKTWKDGRLPNFVTGAREGACPYGQPGDRLWVRESWSGEHWLSNVKPSERLGVANQHRLASFPPETWYWADGSPDDGDWEKPRPSIHMPRWASRITLEITDVRVERLQDISEDDAKAEGVEPKLDGYKCYDIDKMGFYSCAISSFDSLWSSINGPDNWDANPWVWVVEFKRLES